MIPNLQPYPADLEAIVQHRGKTLFIRPVRPDDEPLLVAFVQALSPQDRRFRFFGTFRELSHESAVRLTRIDYTRDMAFLLLDGSTLIGVGRLAAGADVEQAEFALTVASGRHRSRGIKRVVGQVMGENRGMLELAKHLGFVRVPAASSGPEIVVVKSFDDRDPEIKGSQS